MEQVKLGSIEVSRFILGGNPLSGFSHQSAEADLRMQHYFTTARIKRLLSQAESLGLNALIARADHHIMRVLMEYWDEGGRIAWIAQTCPELGTIERGVENAIKGRASACYIHGGVMDHRFANNQLDDLSATVQMIRSAGMPAGIAGHNPEVFRWAEHELDVDFYACSYHNPASRVDSPEIAGGARQWFHDSDRQVMAETIAGLSRPAIHYKVLAAGRNDPAEAFDFVARTMRPGDAVCVGIYDEHNPEMLRQDTELFEASLNRAQSGPLA